MMPILPKTNSEEKSCYQTQDLISVSDLNERRRFIGVMEKANQIALQTDISDLINEMLDLMIEVSGADMALFYQLDGATNDLVIISSRGEIANPSFNGLRFKKDLGIIGTAANSMQPVIVGDLVEAHHWLQAIDPTYASGLQSVITLPLDLKGTFIAAVQFFNYKQAEVDILQVLGIRLINEIDRAGSLTMTLQSNQKLRNLIEILQLVTGSLDRDTLLHLVTEHASLLLNAERSSIFLTDTEDAELNFQVSYKSFREEPEETNLSNTENIINLFQSVKVRSGAPNQGTGQDTPPENEFGFSTRTAITVPLQTETQGVRKKEERKHTFGGLMVLNKLDGDFSPEDNLLLKILASQTSTFLQLVELFENANDLFLGVVKSLVTAIDAKDPYTQGHSLRVSEISVAIAEEIGLAENEVNDIRVGSLLHDIGKIGIPDHILNKAGVLTKVEYDEIRKHTIVGHTIMRQARALQPILPAIISHHERLDGSGYPYGLKGNEIPLMSRIVAVADVYDAMASERPYRSALPIKTVVNHLQNVAGIQLDRECAMALIRVIDTNRLKLDYPDW
jgi:putative nucleotidyltransferase with HDIG domain